MIGKLHECTFIFGSSRDAFNPSVALIRMHRHLPPSSCPGATLIFQPLTFSSPANA